MFSFHSLVFDVFYCFIHGGFGWWAACMDDIDSTHLGYKESAFAYAISAAGITFSIARACSQGRLISCGCDPHMHRKGIPKSQRKHLELDRQHFFQTIDNRIIDSSTNYAAHNQMPR